MAVDEEGVDRPRDVRNVRRVHPHRAPLEAVLERLILPGEQAGDGLLLGVEDASLRLQLLEDLVRVHEREVREHHHVLPVEGDGVGVLGLDDQRTVVTLLFLQPGVTVVPVGPRLNDRELIDERLARLDAREAYARYAVHVEGQDQPVPVDRGVLVQIVGDRDAGDLAFLQANEWARHRPVDGDGVPLAPVDRPLCMADPQLDVGTRERREVAHQPGGAASRPGREQARRGQAGSQQA